MVNTKQKSIHKNLAGCGSSSPRPTLFLRRHGYHVTSLHCHILLLLLGCCGGDDLLLWWWLGGHLSWFLLDYNLKTDRQRENFYYSVLVILQRDVHWKAISLIHGSISTKIFSRDIGCVSQSEVNLVNHTFPWVR